MRILSFLSLFLLTMVTFIAPSHAQEASTIGGIFQEFGNSVFGKGVFYLINSTIILCGMFLVGWGVYSLKDVGDRSQQSVFLGSLSKMFFGSVMFQIGKFTGVGLMSIFNNNSYYSADGIADPGETLNCSSSSAMLECISRNLANNIVPAGYDLIMTLAFFYGVYIVGTTLYKMANHYGHGHRNSQEKGLLWKIIIGIVIINLPQLMGIFGTTLGISDNILGNPTYNPNASSLSYNPSGSGAFEQYANIMPNVFRIMVFFGLLAVIRGIFLLRAAAEGNNGGGQNPMGSGITHIIGGLLLANLKWTITVIFSTLGISTGFI